MNLKEQTKKIVLEIIDELKPNKLLLDFIQKKNFLNFIKKINKFYIISMGKAGYSIAESFNIFLIENQIKNCIGGFVVTPYGTTKQHIRNFEIIESSHPYPDQNSLYAGERFTQIIDSLPKDISILFFLSGGASALIEKPVDGINLENLQDLTKSLLKSGANIKEINTIRKKFSLLKGGGAAEILYPRKVYQFILSDVIGKNSEKYVSSGLLYPESISIQRIKNILKKYNITLDFDISKITFTEKKKTSVKKTWIIGNNQIACEKTKSILERYNFNTKIVKSNFSGSIEQYQEFIQKKIIQVLQRSKKNDAYIWGGEPTLRIQGQGKGGRNQELALRIAIELNNIETKKNFDFVFVSFGTDGIDGPTDAAGAIIDFDTYKEIQNKIQERKLKTTIEQYLQNNDSYHALELSNSLIKIGYTGTNLNDISFLVIKDK